MTEPQQPCAADTGSASRSLAARAAHPHGTVPVALVVGALGVVFGDIGTSLIYTLQTVFNPSKLVHGAWLPLLIGFTAFTVMTTWQRGREIVTAERQRREGPLRDFIDRLRNSPSGTVSVPGTAVFLNRGKQSAPLAMRANVEHNHVRHEHMLILSIETEPVPRVPGDQRIMIDDLGYADDGIIHVTARIGYLETPDVPEVLRLLDPAVTEGRLRLDQASYFLSKIELRRGDRPTMASWRKRLFIITSYITADAAEHFCLPRNRTVIMGSHVDV